MKKITFKTRHFPDMSQTFISNQVVDAIQMGYEVNILVKEKRGMDFSAQPGIDKQFNLASRTFELKDPRPKNSLGGYLKAFGLARKYNAWNALKTFNGFTYGTIGLSGRLFYDCVSMRHFMDTDLFHVQFGVYAEPLVRLKKSGLLNAKIVTTFHGFDAHFNEQQLQEKRIAFKNLFYVGDAFTCNTKYLAGQLMRLGCPEHKLEIIPMGIDVNFFKPGDLKKENAITLLSVGRLVKWKSHDLGIQVADILVKKGYTLKYLIIGEGEEMENLTRLVVKLGLQDHVELLGARDQVFIRDTMQRSDIFLMTSTHDASGRRETQGVVTGEAQACGLPVCAFDSGGVPYTMIDRETGFLSKEGDVEDMATNAETLLLDAKLRHRMASSARQFVTEHYSRKITSGKMQQLYQKLVA